MDIGKLEIMLKKDGTGDRILIFDDAGDAF